MCYCYFYDEVIYVCLYVRMFIFDSNVQSLFCFVYPISDPMLCVICYLIRCIYLCNHFTDTAFCIHSPALSLSLSSYYITWYTYTYTTYTPNTNQTSKSNHITSHQIKKKGLVGAPACGDVMKLQIKVDDDGNVIESKFKTFGCGSAIASSSVATEWVKGKSIDEVVGIKNSMIAAHLKLPPVKLHCSMLAEDAIKAAVQDLKEKQAKAKAQQVA